MTDTVTTPAPKKSNKTLFIIITLVLSFLGYKQYTTHLIWGTDVTVTDSTIVITPTPVVPVDSIKAVTPVADTTTK